MAGDLPKSAGAVVIGGGSTGASTFYHLALAGVERPLLIERGELASGSTGRAAGGIRFQFADEMNVRIMLRSAPYFEHWKEIIGRHLSYLPDLGFHQNGYLLLLSTETDVAGFTRATATQNALGVPTRMLSPEEAREIVPQVDPTGLLAASFGPRDGYSAPEAFVQGMAAAGVALGGQVFTNCVVLGIDTSSDRVTGVVTSRGTIATERVICTAGVWSRQIGAMVGIDIPVEGQLHTWHFSPVAGGLADGTPLTIDFSTGLYCRREGPGVMFGNNTNDLAEVLEVASHRLPFLTELPIQASVSGYYDVSPDHNAIVGGVEHPRGFYLATGFSGHGYMQGPALGEHLAELALGQKPSLDLSPLSLDRFRTGRLRREAFVI